jgi:hypothetical protein
MCDRRSFGGALLPHLLPCTVASPHFPPLCMLSARRPRWPDPNYHCKPIPFGNQGALKWHAAAAAGAPCPYTRCGSPQPSRVGALCPSTCVHSTGSSRVSSSTRGIGQLKEQQRNCLLRAAFKYLGGVLLARRATMAWPRHFRLTLPLPAFHHRYAGRRLPNQIEKQLLMD